jgi:cytochrome c oxidase subunit 3
MLGMHIFLASEVMLFGGLFAVAFALRLAHPDEYVAASRRLHLWIGAANTALLLTSSLAVAAAAVWAGEGRRRRTAASLAGAAALGLAFLAVKAVEYSLEAAEGLLPGFADPPRFDGPVERLFMDLYLVATGLHAVHLTVGIALLGTIAWRATRGSLALPRRAATVEAAGLYWHLVDVIWVFLYPVLYLAR